MQLNYPIPKFKGWLKSKIPHYFKTRNRNINTNEALIKNENTNTYIVEFRGTRIICRQDNKLEYKLLTDPDSYDESNFYAITSLVKEGATCFDIGANIGIYSLVLSHLVGTNGQIHAFEPVDHIRHKFLVNLAFNGAKNVLVRDFALGDRLNELPMYQVKEGLFRGGTSTFVHNNNVEVMGEDAFERRTVRIMKLDEYVAEQNLTRLDFIKIDVEGFELNVFQGAINTLAKFKPTILFEHDQNRLNGLKILESQFSEILSNLGYSCFEVFNDGRRNLLAPYCFDRKLKGNNLLAIYISIGE
ncbi:FkbM family methyltransferase [Nostoc sp. CENA67]|uniref:FkbM family methyltransferase n=1 Tax=Amazonocrinis nigriterrae CENA67 TaxID=2794033 RepID=A0A8J7I0Z0_9NOST|nr:FkbM family methyltransferase [Amazonocrinis nigriterrae]MBH8566034.1 FkbM family methyltransferase [Amazonocrinis nigriterrae CENA67]